jgi:phytol kinase
MLGTLRKVQCKLNPDPELMRKLFHVGMGIFALSFPFLIPNNFVAVVLCGATMALLTALRRVEKLRDSYGAVLGSVTRDSHGELYFAVGVTAIFCWAKDENLLYVIPILVLTFADAAAALIGERFGRHQFCLIEGRKSIEGSFAFLTVATACIYKPLVVLTSIDPASAIWLAVTLGLILMLVEALSWRGLDNLFIPVTGCLFLKDLLSRTIEELIGVAVLTLLLIFSLLLGQDRKYAENNSRTRRA